MNWKPTVRTALLVVLVVVSISYAVRADTPSPNNWTFGGGGFCSGTYKIFNSTDNKLYAQNCSTGANDYGGFTDLGLLLTSNVFPAMRNHYGGEIDFAQGFFGISTSITVATANDDLNGLRLKGAGAGFGQNDVGAATQDENGTIIVAQANSFSMIQQSAGSSTVTCNSSTCTGTNAYHTVGVHFSDFTLSTGAHTGVIGIDWRCAETSTGAYFDHIAFRGVQSAGIAGFSTSFMLDGNEDTWVSYMDFAGDGSATDGTATNDLQWQVPNGNVNVDHTFFGGVLNLLTSAQTISVEGSTITDMKLLNVVRELSITNTYFANSATGWAGLGRVNLNGMTLSEFTTQTDHIYLTAAPNGPLSFFSGTGTVANFAMIGCSFQTNGSTTWNAGAATLTHQISPGNTGAGAGTNHLYSGTSPTGFPFTVDGSGNF